MTDNTPLTTCDVPLVINAIFALACGCTMDGCHHSDPGRKWAAGVRNGLLYCTEHRSWQTLVDVVSLDPMEALPDA